MGKRAVVTGAEESGAQLDPATERARTLAICGWILGFFLAIWLLGFSYAAVIATFLYLKFGSCESWLTSIALGFASWLFYGLFDHLLHLPFPVGSLFE